MNASYIDYRILGDSKVRQTVKQIEEMATSPFWLDCFDFINELLAERHFALENPRGELSHADLDRIGGNCETLRMLAQFPQMLIQKRLQQDEDKLSKGDLNERAD